MLVAYSDETQRITFVNNWGEEWGDKGFGYLPYELFELYLIEAWILEAVGEPLPGRTAPGITEIRWARPDFAGRMFHGRDIYDAGSDERIGWAFAIQEQAFLSVEELYVRPQYRRQGYGTRLLQSLTSLSTETNLPLGFFIPFADCKPENLGVVEHLFSKEEYFLFENSVRWSPLIALHPVNVRSLSLELPSPPALCSPRSRLGSNGIPLPALGENEVEPRVGPRPVSEVFGLLTSQAAAESVAVGTPEWEDLTNRRARLIHKKNREGLSGLERIEFDRLQRISGMAIGKAFKRPRFTAEELEVINKANSS